METVKNSKIAGEKDGDFEKGKLGPWMGDF